MSEKIRIRRKKPKFLRKDWHKKIKLGSKSKKRLKWRGAKGRQNKIRLGRKGYSQRPKIGWGTSNKPKSIRIENLKAMDGLKSGQEILVGRVGLKKKKEIIEKANKMKLVINNKYREKKDATK